MSRPGLGSPRALPRLIKPAPRFPATTILLKNHLSLAVRLGTGDYKQLRKTADWGPQPDSALAKPPLQDPFSWPSGSADRQAAVRDGNSNSNRVSILAPGETFEIQCTFDPLIRYFGCLFFLRGGFEI